MQFVLVLLAGTAGMLACNLYRRKGYGLSVVQSIIFTLLLTAVGVAGTKLLFFAESGFQSWDGVSFFGSVFVIPLIMPLIGYLFGLTHRKSLDLCGPCVAVMIAVMRVNCFLSGCCGGWQVCLGAVCFRWPTQILESFGDVLILSYLLNQEKKVPFSGKGYPLFMLLYGVMRFLLEFLRDTPKDWLLLSHGQWFSLAAMAVGGIAMLVIKRRSVRYGGST